MGERIRKHNPNRYGGVPIKMVESLDLSSWRVPSWTDIVYVANEFFIWVCRVKPLNEYVFIWLFRVRPHKRFIYWIVSCQAPPRASWDPKGTQYKCRRQHIVSKQKTQRIISCVTLGTCVHYVWIFCWRQESQQRCLFVCLFVCQAVLSPCSAQSRT